MGQTSLSVQLAQAVVEREKRRPIGRLFLLGQLILLGRLERALVPGAGLTSQLSKQNYS